ncbi:hypothetical protein [Photobacterium lipolyticum]|uniref:Response regulator n=1 Tax=Photobacterium lipolyticum TaxID=266810 RepID=A0A2T3N1K6_9GAMM|nr:hypothetical protein [Photobacterium lipolyticum]PSW06074.1 hypothetical protein C9I89_06055 [Photobacterium lipolyticum]
MVAKIKINRFMYNLLIEKKLDGFSVTEARDAILSYDSSLEDTNQARKVIYRQILSFLGKGWLRDTGEGHNKHYWVTDTFKQLPVEPRSGIKSADLNEEKEFKSATKATMGFDQLFKEKSQYEGELSITLGEVEELRSLIERFPKKAREWTPFFIEAKERSATLLGRINALEKVLKHDAKAVSKC